MKYYCLIVAVLSFMSCDNNETQNATHFTYKNHDYIRFYNIGFESSGYVHDPDCKYCLERFD